jgi:hypothetical protein
VEAGARRGVQYPEMRNWLIKQWGDIKGNAKWELIKYAITLFGAFALAFSAVLWQALRHTEIDRYLFGIVFLLSAIMFSALVRKIPSPSHSVRRSEITPIESQSQKLVAGVTVETVFDAELLQRVFISPRIGIPYKILQDVWHLSKRSDEPKVDCDILVAMYIVIQSWIALRHATLSVK